jgi:ankyrin repeat protein
MFKKLFLQILLLCSPLNILKLQAKDDKSVASFAITDHKVLAPELGKALVDQGYIEKLYQSEAQTALTKLVKGCYHILDGKLRRTNQVHNAAHYLTPQITAKLIMAVTGNYNQETLIKEWQAASKEHKLQRSHIKDLIKLLNNALTETKDNHLSHLPLAVVIGTLSLHPEAASQIVDFKKAIAQINNAYSDLSLTYDFDSLKKIKQLTYPPSFISINLGYKGKISAPPCMEDALRNICYALLWNTETACLDLKQINQELKLNSNFLNFISKYQDGKNLTSIECAQDWLNLVSGLDNVEYFKADYELCGHIENGLKVLNYLFGTKAQNLSQFLDQVSTNQNNFFANNHDESNNKNEVGEITLNKGSCNFKILVHFSYNHAQANIQRPDVNQSFIAQELISEIQNTDLSLSHQKIGVLLLVSKFKNECGMVWASQNNKLNLIKFLINTGADINDRDDSGYNALRIAAGYGHTEIVKLLLANGANVNSVDNDSFTALMSASGYGHTEIAKLLIAAGADVCTNNIASRTALMMAAFNNYPEVAKLLIEAGADVNAKDDTSGTALIDAAQNGHTNVVNLLINAGADINARDNDMTAILFAAQNGHTDVVNLLINAGADINARDNKYGGTALIWAVHEMYTEIARLLINAGADVNYKDATEEGRSALIWAAARGHTAVVKILLNAGADINDKDNNGETALQCAIRENHAEIEQLLRTHVAR